MAFPGPEIQFCPLHGEDISLLNTGTKAHWKDSADIRSSRAAFIYSPIKVKEAIKVRLSWTGVVRFGITKFDPSSAASLTCSQADCSVVETVFDNHRQFDIVLSDDGRLCFIDEHMNERFIGQFDNCLFVPLFLLCEVQYGNIELKVDGVDGTSLLSAAERGDELLFDEEKQSISLKPTASGGVCIPCVQLPEEVPVTIRVNPKQDFTSGLKFFHIRWGFTTTDPTEPVDGGVSRFSLVSEKRRLAESDDKQGDSEATFCMFDSFVERDSFKGEFQLELTTDLDIRHNITIGCEEDIVSVNLQRPLWLVLEAYQADVSVIISRPADDRKSRFIFAKWTSRRNISASVLRSYIKTKEGDIQECVIGKASDKAAVLIFEKEKKASFLLQVLKQPKASDWHFESMQGIEDTKCVQIHGLPSDAKKRDVKLFLEVRKNVGIGTSADVLEEYFTPQTGFCVAELTSAEVVKTICARKIVYSKTELKIQPFYRELNPVIKLPDPLEYNFGSREKYVKKHALEKLKKAIGNQTRLSWPVKGSTKLTLAFAGSLSINLKSILSWRDDTDSKFETFMNGFVVHEKRVDDDGQGRKILECLPATIAEVSYDATNRVITVVGKASDDDVEQCLAIIDSILSAPKETTRTIGVDHDKLRAVVEMGIVRGIESETKATINVDTETLTVTGVPEVVNKAYTEICLQLTKLKKIDIRYPTPEYGRILNTRLMQGVIHRDVVPVTNTSGMYWAISEQQITIFHTSQQPPDEQRVKNEVFARIKQEEIPIRGQLSPDGRQKIEKAIADIESEYDPYIIFSYNRKSGVIIITCGEDYYDIAFDGIESVVNEVVETKEVIALPRLLLNYINSKMEQELQKLLKKQMIGVTTRSIEFLGEGIQITGQAGRRNEIKKILFREICKVNTVWKCLEMPGIYNYFTDDESMGISSLKGVLERCKCEGKVATKKEMKDRQIYCIGLTSIGQSVFVAEGNVSDLKNFWIDTLAIEATPTLQHPGSLAEAVLRKGGAKIQHDCDKFIGDLSMEESEVFLGMAGDLEDCKRLAHVVIGAWQGTSHADDQLLSAAVVNVLHKMTEAEGILLRTLALPLIGAGRSVTQQRRTARVILKTLFDCCPGKFPNIREVYMFDKDPETVRNIQQEMEVVFGEACYRQPVENIAVNKGRSIAGNRNLLKREGKRIIPLPAGKTLTLRYGELQKENAEYVVNPVCSSAILEGPIARALSAAADRAGDFNLQGQFQKECRDRQKTHGKLDDGVIIMTNSGSLPCSKVLHLQIGPWRTQTGQERLKGYIKACLGEAVRGGVSTIAFPTIGTALPQQRGEQPYPAEEVAEAMIRTVGECMKIHAGSKLKDIRIVIFETDETTSQAFENKVEEIFANRTHRLEAVIKESFLEDRRSPSPPPDISSSSPRKSAPFPRGVPPSKNPPAPPQQPSAQQPSAPGQQPSAPGQQQSQQFPCQFSLPHQAVLSLELVDIQNAKTDVIVSTTSSFPILNGQISNAILSAAGHGVQDQCKNKFPGGYPTDGRVAVTQAGKLPQTKFIHHVKLTDYKGAKDDKIIVTFVTSCLEEAETSKMDSIAFPCIGVGGFKYPDKISAAATFKAIDEFYKKKQRQHPSRVLIALYKPSVNTNQIFQNAASSLFPSTVPNPIPHPQPAVQLPQSAPGHVPGGTDQSDLSITFPNTATSLTLQYGNIEEASADVIVDTTTSFPRLNGAIPDALRKAAGPSLQDECTRLQNKVNDGEIAVTGGGNLHCKKVYHYVLPTWRQQDGLQMIAACVELCLDRLVKAGHSTIAFPAIGTGGAKYPAPDVAKGIFSAVRKFGTQCPGRTCHVVIVLFPAAKDVNQVFQTEFAVSLSLGTPPAGENRGPKPKQIPQKRKKDDYTYQDHFDPNATPLSEEEVKRRQSRDFVLLQLTSHKDSEIEKAFKEMAGKVKAESSRVEVAMLDEKKELQVIIKPENISKIKELERAFNVKLSIKGKEKMIVIEGMGGEVMKAHQQVIKTMYDICRQYNQLQQGEIIFKDSEWCYTEDKNNLLVPYPKWIAFKLEEAHAKGEKKRVFKDTDGTEYEVDFTSMQEYPVGNKSKNNIVHVVKKDYASGDVEPLPGFWDIMAEMDNFKEVPLRQGDTEYRQVEQTFRGAFLNVPALSIKEIRRIQNRSLYQQYHLKKRQLETKHKNDPSITIEMELWHGTKEENQKSIETNGFDRGLAGNTHGGVWYGEGVYFATIAEYANDPRYSVPDAAGNKRMFQVKVLTGKYCAVPMGTRDRVPPLLHGSQTDRFDSVCDDVANTKEFVIFNDTQAYPEYIIIYQ